MNPQGFSALFVLGLAMIVAAGVGGGHAAPPPPSTGGPWGGPPPRPDDWVPPPRLPPFSFESARRNRAAVILKVRPYPTPEEVKKAYHRMALQTHPDTGGSNAAFLQIKEARDILLGKCSTEMALSGTFKHGFEFWRYAELEPRRFQHLAMLTSLPLDMIDDVVLRVFQGMSRTFAFGVGSRVTWLVVTNFNNGVWSEPVVLTIGEDTGMEDQADMAATAFIAQI